MAKKIPVGIRVDEELIERLRNAVWNVGRGLSITSVMEDAMHRVVTSLEEGYNNGKPFRRRNGEVAKSNLGRNNKKKK